MSNSLDKIIIITRGFRTKKLYREEAPVNNVGGGQIAGTSQAGDDPPVDLRKKKTRKWNPFFKDLARVQRRNASK